MSDSKARQMERTCMATGSLQDQAALIRAHIRLGSLSVDHVELAATCGHPAAQLAIGMEPITDPEAWSRRANDHNESVKQRIALRLGEYLLRALAPFASSMTNLPLWVWADAPDVAWRVITGTFDRRQEDGSKLSAVKSLYLRADDLGPRELATQAALEACFGWVLSGKPKAVDLVEIARHVLCALESLPIAGPQEPPLASVLSYLRRDEALCPLPEAGA